MPTAPAYNDLLGTFADMVAERVAAKMGTADSRALSTAEAAKATGMSVAMIRSAARSGELPYVGVGRVFRFLRKDLDAWIKRNRTE